MEIVYLKGTGSIGFSWHLSRQSRSPPRSLRSRVGMTKVGETAKEIFSNVSGILAKTDEKTLLLLKPRGFCAGVVRAIDVVRIALEAFGPPIYVRKEIVHNSFVVEELRSKGAIFVDSEDEVPDGERIIYSAHGVSPEVREHSAKRGLRVIDATCPLVTKVHVEAVKFAKEGYSLILIGHKDHDEVLGTLGEAPLVTQVVGSPEQVDVADRSRSGSRGVSDADHAEPG